MKFKLISDLEDVQCGPLIRRPVDPVGGMAIRTDGGHQQPRLDQSVTVRARSECRLFLPVTASAGLNLLIEKHR